MSCKCGCGGPVKPGNIYINGHNRHGRIRRFKDKRGYIHIYRPNHPFTDKNGYVYEHRLVMEAHLGRYLTPNEVVHHKKSRSNNNIENLELKPNQATHARTHMIGNNYSKIVDHTNTKCIECGSKNTAKLKRNGRPHWLNKLDGDKHIGYICHNCYRKSRYKSKKEGILGAR